MKNIKIKFTNKRIIPANGFAVIGAILGHVILSNVAIVWILPKIVRNTK